MLKWEGIEPIRYFMRAYPRRSILMLAALLLSGLLEGLGITAVLPLLELATEKEAETTFLSRQVHAFLDKLSIEPSLGILLLFLVAVIALKGAFFWLAMRQVGYTIAKVAADMRMKLIRALLRAEWRHFVSRPAGSFASVMSVEVNHASNGYYEASQAIASACQVLVYTGIAALLSWKLSVLAVVAGATLMLPLAGYIARSRQAGRERAKYVRALSVRLTDALQGMKPIKSMACEDRMLPLFESETKSLQRAQMNTVLAKQMVVSLQEPLIVAVFAASIYVAVALFQQSFSSFMVLGFVCFRLVTRIGLLQQDYQRMVVFEGAFWAVHNALTEADAQREVLGGRRPPPHLDRDIVFDDVTFSYQDRKILDRLSATFRSGEFSAIVGPSGVGKTTVADLLIGLFRPQSGTVLIDGVPLQDIDLTAWRQRIGYVPQEMFLFHSSIFDNVVLGDPALTRQDAENAIRSAGAWDFVGGLPEGMDSIIGERGAKISGGERQRIAIARALARRPRLLILDEVTTSLDPATEACILDSLRRLRGQVTIIAISHQQSLMSAADTVYQLEHGKLERRK